MFKKIEIDAWYRIRWEGKSVFGQVLERHRNSYTFRYVDEKGKVRTGKVSRSDITGRLGDHLIPDLESAKTPVKRQRAAKPKAETPNAISPGDWHHFQYEGNTVPGVVYRIEGDNYTMFLLYKGIPTFVTLPQQKLGSREERLTAVFREEMAKNPKHMEEWVSTVGRHDKETQARPVSEPSKEILPSRNANTRRKKKPSIDQRPLFPE